MKLARAVLGLLSTLGCSAEPLPVEPNLASAEALAQAVEASNLMPLVQRLADDHLADAKLSCEGWTTEELYPACELSRDLAEALVRDRLTELGYEPQTLLQGDGSEPAHNVTAERLGTTRPWEVVLVAAHIDAFYAGADDNSSGVAGLLEIARVVAQHRFARTIRFVAFDLEEHGAAGSARYADAGLADDVVAALVLECIGYADRREGSQDSPWGLELGDKGDSLLIAANQDSEQLARRMLAMNHALDLIELRAVIAGGNGAFPLIGALLRSDNGPLWLRGVPALLLTDSANFRNPHYHRASDTPETLDPEFLAAATRTAAAALALFAEPSP